MTWDKKSFAHSSCYLGPHTQALCKAHPHQRGRGWGCTEVVLLPSLFSQVMDVPFHKQPCRCADLFMSMLTDVMFTNPLPRSSNKTLFSQEMASLVYLNENAVVSCFTLHWKSWDQRFNTRSKIRSSFVSKPCSLCLWYANKLSRFDNIKLLRGSKYKLSTR